MIARIGLTESADAPTREFASVLACRLAHINSDAAVEAIVILGLGEPYALRPDDPPVRVFVPLLHGRRPGPIAREQLRWAPGIVITHDSERRWMSETATDPAVVIATMAAAGPILPSSPVDRHAVSNVMRKYGPLSSSLALQSADGDPVEIVAQACLECALAVAVDANGPSHGT